MAAATAKSRNDGRKRTTSLNLKTVVEKLRRSLSLARRSYPYYNNQPTNLSVPQDVKEGHFAVIAIGDGQPKRYIVSLAYLSHPAFRRLLERAAEEYGFDNEGALTVPCRSKELESILAQQWKEHINTAYANVNMDFCNRTLVKSC